VFAQDLLGLPVDLAERDGLESTRALEAQVEATDASEER
jgi:hypothetical protein